MKRYKINICVAFIFICFILTTEITNSSAHELNIPLSVLLQSQGNDTYLPIIINSVPEKDYPPCRWPHLTGEYDPRYFIWGNYLQSPGTPWRTAFESAIYEWNIAPTKIYFSYSNYGTVLINLYWA